MAVITRQLPVKVRREDLTAFAAAYNRSGWNHCENRFRDEGCALSQLILGLMQDLLW